MRKTGIKAYLYILPALFLATLFVYYPFLKSALSSFFLVRHDGSLGAFVGLENYRKLFETGIFQESLAHTFLFMALFVPLNTIIIFIAALLTEQKRKGNSLFETIFMLPMAMGLSSAALLFKFLFNPSAGMLNRILKINVGWNTEALPALFSVVFLGVFLDFGLDYLLLLSALRNVNKSVLEAGRVDGAGEGRIFFSLRLPLVAPTLSYVIFIAIKDALLICSPIMVMTEGGPYRSTQTVVYYYYIEAFKNSNFASAACVSTLVFVIAGFFLLLFSFYQKRRLER